MESHRAGDAVEGIFLGSSSDVSNLDGNENQAIGSSYRGASPLSHVSSSGLCSAPQPESTMVAVVKHMRYRTRRIDVMV